VQSFTGIEEFWSSAIWLDAYRLPWIRVLSAAEPKGLLGFDIHSHNEVKIYEI